jgi:hypothetical protein
MFTFDGSIVSDLHKGAYGFRPMSSFWDQWNAGSDADKQHIWDHLLEELDYTVNREANEKIAAVNAFELEVANALDLGASSRDVAIRWVVQSMKLTEFDLAYGGSHICYIKDLPYSMAPLFDNAITFLMKEAA